MARYGDREEQGGSDDGWHKGSAHENQLDSRTETSVSH